MVESEMKRKTSKGHQQEDNFMPRGVYVRKVQGSAGHRFSTSTSRSGAKELVFPTTPQEAFSCRIPRDIANDILVMASDEHRNKATMAYVLIIEAVKARKAKAAKEAEQTENN